MVLITNSDEHGQLLDTINSLREEMIQTGLQEGLNSENTIILSQKLDVYIARYQSLSQRV